MAKRTDSKPLPGRKGARLSQEQAVQLVDEWTLQGLFTDDESISDFLLLLYTISGIDKALDREGFVIQIENLLMPYSSTVSQAMTDLIVERAASGRYREQTGKGGANG
jgi:hypothetical protein